jgi:hypothetical protein
VIKMDIVEGSRLEYLGISPGNLNSSLQAVNNQLPLVRKKHNPGDMRVCERSPEKCPLLDATLRYGLLSLYSLETKARADSEESGSRASLSWSSSDLMTPPAWTSIIRMA